ADYTTTVDIETLKKQGYVLVSDQTGGAKPSFGTTSPTTYEVHLKHDTEKKEETKAVERTIHYVYEDGTRAAADKTDTVTFTRTATKD
ncbi:mucin-binding protein, partial [Bacillus paralicheniformis]|uniref:mucin-binding protein n=1 Tax=Bacillus paralicheniformis TaxID=1648923 RepID=UPI003F4A3A5A